MSFNRWVEWRQRSNTVHLFPMNGSSPPKNPSWSKVSGHNSPSSHPASRTSTCRTATCSATLNREACFPSVSCASTHANSSRQSGQYTVPMFATETSNSRIWCSTLTSTSRWSISASRAPWVGTLTPAIAMIYVGRSATNHPKSWPKWFTSPLWRIFSLLGSSSLSCRRAINRLSRHRSMINAISISVATISWSFGRFMNKKSAIHLVIISKTWWLTCSPTSLSNALTSLRWPCTPFSRNKINR